MIEVSGLTKTYGAVRALDNLSFTVGKGQIVGFLGANGAGKTTTMDIICGCLGADSGSVKICGIDVLEDPIEAKKRLGYLPDEPPIYDDMKVRDYIEYAALLNMIPRTELKRRVDETIEKLSLGQVAHRLVGNLSKGFRQRVGLAQAIVHNPDVLILDEPTEGLDPNQIVHIRELIQQLGGQHTIMLSSHILSEVQNTCDHIVIIHKGKIVQQGTYNELLSTIKDGRVFQLRVANGSEKLLSEIRSIGGVTHAEMLNPREHRLQFALTEGDEALDRISEMTIKGGYGMRELSTKGKSLEAIFFELTN
jgi:ABC-2 type transport system ATP-binding protein